MRFRVVFDVEVGPYCGQNDTPHLRACYPTAAEVRAVFGGFVENEVLAHPILSFEYENDEGVLDGGLAEVRAWSREVLEVEEGA